MFKMLGKLVWIGLLVSLVTAACTGATPAPEPTPIPPTATAESTATPVPPTATPQPTATPVPKPRLENLRFGTSVDSSTASGKDATFSVGVPAIFASVDYIDLPANTKLTWRITGPHGDEIKDEILTSAAGTASRDLFGNVRKILPGKYTVVVRTDKQLASATFTVDLKDLKTGDDIVVEPFDDNGLGWTLADSALGTATIADGKLTLTVQRNSPITAASIASLTDFDLSADILFESGPTDGYVSVALRSGYSLELFANARLVMTKMTDVGQFEAALTLDKTPGFKRGDVNRLRVVARGERLAVYLNDTLVGSLTDQPLKTGYLAFSAAMLSKGTPLVVSVDNVSVKVPPDQVAVMPTPTKGPTATPKPIGTPKPTATKKAATPPLADAIKNTRNAVEAIGGAMDRLYHGGGSESCTAFMQSYFRIIGSPTYDVASQPSNVQGAYGQYRQAVDFISGSKVTQIAKVCLQGGGNIGALDFNEARQAVNTAGSWLTQALAALGL
ncbi:MAG: hypothetical protein U0559_00840 [Anaerolineae bacterium]